MQAWGQRALTFIDTGQPAPDASTFAFTTPGFNGPLFNPAIAAVRTIGHFGGETIDLCQNPEQEEFTGPMPGLAPLAGSPAGREYLTTGVITTNTVTQIAAAFAHIEAIVTAPVGSQVIVTVNGELLTSQGLPPVAANLHGGGGNWNTPVYAAVSPETQAWLTLLAGEAADLAAAQDLSRASLAPLTGAAAPVVALGEQIATFAAQTLNRPLTVYPVYVLFEDYGALPVLVGVYDDFSAEPGALGNDHRFFVLFDGVDGTMDGPFMAGDVIWPGNLLANHPEASDVGPGEWLVINQTGCPSPLAAKWNPEPPFPGPTQIPGGPPVGPWTLIPPGPANPFPGQPTPWRCMDTAPTPGTAACVCTQDFRINCL